MIPPNLWAEIASTIGGYIIPELLIAAAFSAIAYFTAGAGAAGLSARLGAFVAKVVASLSKAGKAESIILQVFRFLAEIASDMKKLGVAVRKNIDEVIDSTTGVITRIVRRSGKRIKPPKEIPCFNKPAGVNDAEFMQQLAEQENAINNSDISELIARRDMVKKVGTSALRDKEAQAEARVKWLDARTREIFDTGKYSLEKADAMAAAEAAKLDATHVLDIIARGDPSAVSGLQSRVVNRFIGSQWKRRVDALDNALAEHAAKGGIKANVRLKKC